MKDIDTCVCGRSKKHNHKVCDVCFAYAETPRVQKVATVDKNDEEMSYKIRTDRLIAQQNTIIKQYYRFFSELEKYPRLSVKKAMKRVRDNLDSDLIL